MEAEVIVRRALRRRAAPGLVAAVACAVLGVLHTVLVFWLGSWLGPRVLWFWKPAPAFLPLLSGGVTVAAAVLCPGGCYWTTFTYDSRMRGEIPLQEGPSSPFLHALFPCGSALGLPVDMQLFGPASLNLFTKMVVLPLVVGGFLLAAAWRNACSSVRLLSVAPRRLAAPLVAVLAAGGRMSYDDLNRAVPGFVPERDAPLLALVDGVVPVSKDRPGIALADRLQDELRTGGGVR